jgi:hypothetical protein
VESTLILFHALLDLISPKAVTQPVLVHLSTKLSEKEWVQLLLSRIANYVPSISTAQEVLLIPLNGHAQMVEFALPVTVNLFCVQLDTTVSVRELSPLSSSAPKDSTVQSEVHHQ